MAEGGSRAGAAAGVGQPSTVELAGVPVDRAVAAVENGFVAAP